jgi:hypothetical protein
MLRFNAPVRTGHPTPSVSRDHPRAGTDCILAKPPSNLPAQLAKGSLELRFASHLQASHVTISLSTRLFDSIGNVAIYGA